MDENVSGLVGEDGSLLSQLGPQHLPYNSLVPMTVVYIVIFCTGMVGNCATCIVIAKNQYMQSATNYYLFNLAVADMLTLAFGKCPILFITFDLSFFFFFFFTFLSFQFISVFF